MASTKLKETRDGRRYYEIRVRMGRDGTTLSSRWYVPEGWAQSSVDRELRKQAAEFELRCKAGEVVSRAEMKARQEEEAREAAKIQTLRQYGERVFMPAKKVTISENTRDGFQRALDVHIYPTLGDKKLPEITPADITAFLLQKQDEGQSQLGCFVITISGVGAGVGEGVGVGASVGEGVGVGSGDGLGEGVM